jgi:hypothetical protein
MSAYAHDWDENGFCRECTAMQCLREVKGYGKERRRCKNEQAPGSVLCTRHLQIEEEEARRALYDRAI